MTPEAVKEYVDRVRSNRIKLDSCKLHQFNATKSLSATCLNCDGDMLVVAIKDYVAGYIAAGGKETDIWTEASK